MRRMRLRKRGVVCLKDEEYVTQVDAGAEGPNELYPYEWVLGFRTRGLDNGLV